MIVKLPNEVTLNRVAAIRNELLPALRSHEAIELDAQAVNEVDVAGLQLLCSLHRSAREQNTAISFVGGSPGGPIEDAQRRAGFTLAGCASVPLQKRENHG